MSKSMIQSLDVRQSLDARQSLDVCQSLAACWGGVASPPAPPQTPPENLEGASPPQTLPPPPPRVGGDGDDGDGDGRISPEHPSPILHAPRDIISRKGKSLTPSVPAHKTS